MESNVKEEGSEESLPGETKTDVSAYFSFCIWDIAHHLDRREPKRKKWVWGSGNGKHRGWKIDWRIKQLGLWILISDIHGGISVLIKINHHNHLRDQLCSHFQDKRTETPRDWVINSCLYHHWLASEGFKFIFKSLSLFSLFYHKFSTCDSQVKTESLVRSETVNSEQSK